MARRKTLLTLLVACLAAFAAALCCALCAQQKHAAAGDAELDKSGAPMQTLAFADVICDDMLYQQGKPVAVWGFAPRAAASPSPSPSRRAATRCGGLTGGEIAGIVCGCVAAIAAAVAVCLLVKKRKRK